MRAESLLCRRCALPPRAAHVLVPRVTFAASTLPIPEVLVAEVASATALLMESKPAERSAEGSGRRGAGADRGGCEVTAQPNKHD